MILPSDAVIRDDVLSVVAAGEEHDDVGYWELVPACSGKKPQKLGCWASSM
jgi:hypothetical protein